MIYARLARLWLCYCIAPGCVCACTLTLSGVHWKSAGVMTAHLECHGQTLRDSCSASGPPLIICLAALTMTACRAHGPPRPPGCGNVYFKRLCGSGSGGGRSKPDSSGGMTGRLQKGKEFSPPLFICFAGTPLLQSSARAGVRLFALTARRLGGRAGRGGEGGAGVCRHRHRWNSFPLAQTWLPTSDLL